MSLNAAPAEFSPLESPEPAGPELRLITGAGEGAPDIAAPDLYAVPDSVDSPSETDPETDMPEGAVEEEPSTVHRKAAKAAGRILRSVTASEQAATSSDSQHHRRGGGGGWALGEFLRKQAAKEQHESECGCQYCAA